MKKTIVQVKKNFLDYNLLERLTAGLVLKGSEIKSIREKKVSISEAYVSIRGLEAFIVNMNVSHYKNSHSFSLVEGVKRMRKLLLNKKEIKRIFLDSKRGNLVIIPLEIFINDKGKAKLEIALAQRLKKYQLKEKIKEREIKRNINKGNFFN